MAKIALILFGSVAAATTVMIDGKVKPGFTNLSYEGGKPVLVFGEEKVTVGSLTTKDVTDYGKGSQFVKRSNGALRTIRSKGETHIMLGGPRGLALKNPEDVTFDELATDYIPSEYASALGSSIVASDDEI